MAVEQVVQFGFLNMVATPHPAGVYARLLNAVANTPVRFWGDTYAAITPLKPDPNKPTLHLSRLVIWTEIDPDAPAINKTKLTETSLSDLDFSAPANVGFNGRSFYWMLNEKTHVLSFELTNEQGKTISIGRCARIFEWLLSPEMLGYDAEAVEITVLPEEDALQRVLGIERLDRIDILVKRPNADDITAKTNAIMAELDEQNVKRQEITFIRENGTDGIELNEKNRTIAEVAAHNGYVASKGRDGEGISETRSTKEYPKIIKVSLDIGATAIGNLRNFAESIRANRE
ncbi:hypothetical protein BH11PSE5_BH11PSE5_13520 [soil metagenome]